MKQVLRRLKIWQPINKKYGTKGIVVLAIVIIAILACGGGAVRALLLGPTNGNNTVDLSKGLVAWWKMDGNAKDATPNANNGTVNGATLTTDRENKTNSAYSFNGTSSYIDVGNGSTISMGASSLTQSAWIKTSTFGGVIMSKRDGGGINNYSLGISAAGKVSATFDDGNASHTVTVNSSTTVADGAWHQVSATYNRSGSLTVYVDSRNENSASISAYNTSIVSSNTLKIGRDSYAASSYFNGSIDDARLYRRALNASEVSALAKQYDVSAKIASGEKGLVGWYKMDGSPKDATPNANPGVLSGTTLPVLTTDRKGKANSAYSFDGSSSYINAGNGSSITMANSSMTMCAWFKTSNNSSTQIIANKRDAGPSQMYGLAINGGKVFAQFGNGVYVTGTTNVADNTWHHACVTFARGGNMTIYADGNAEGSVSISAYSGSNFSPSNTFKIGRDSYASTSFFQGSLDDVRIYRRLLPASEIMSMTKNYNSQINIGAGVISSSNSVNLNNGLVGEWDFNGNAKDATPYSNNGTVAPGTSLTADRNNRANSAYQFTNSANSYIQVPDNPVFHPSAITLSAWINPTAWATANASSIISRRDVANNFGFYLFYFNPTPRISVDFGGPGNRFVTSPSYVPPFNQWTHLVYTYNISNSPTSTRSKIYVNGVLYGTSSVGSSANAQSASNMRFGNDTGGNNYPWIGKIDDIRIYNRDINANEVTALYNTYK